MFAKSIDNERDSSVRKRLRVDSHTNLACKALSIVLQYWLIPPDLTIPEERFDTSLVSLREEFVQCTNLVERIPGIPLDVTAEVQRRQSLCVDDWQSLSIPKEEIQQSIDWFRGVEENDITPIGSFYQVSSLTV